ncbi:MAG: Spy/CpxP family protein refolding chaperone [Cyclobacteriaceae bacterium]
MKKIILSLSLMLLVTLAWSQRPGGGQRPERPSTEEMVEQATKDLSLTDEQVQQWTEIHEKYESDMKDQSKARETMQVMGKELEATLTDEQLEKFKKTQKRQGPPRG